MGDAVEVVHGAVDRVDDPLPFGGLVAGDSFLAVERVSRAGVEKDAGDQLLRLLVERELDVVMGRFIDVEWGAEILVQEFAGFFGGVGGECEIGHWKREKLKG